MKKLGLLALLTLFKVQAAELTVVDSQGQALPNAVVWFKGEGSKQVALTAPQKYEMGQKQRSFVPHILVVPQGAEVDFPNFDNILHHVYSFSSSKAFELKLYRDKPHAPIRFDTSGIVELGCNIHDWMLGYIVVVDSPLFGVTDENGRWQGELPFGEYQLKVWHERFQDLNTPEQLVWRLNAEQNQLRYQIKQQLMEKREVFSDELDGYED
ncbi:methylamine utilization protein [Pseudoalteromonas fenneropenaei]|uniref:Methylamine utilization protein n=1 Tax=Pseudoalteromonas fenneropenaei TaxID=1737459 RepID=A0ABV7CM60_9GAMM